MRKYFLWSFFLFVKVIFGQETVKGSITDKQGIPVEGANVSLLSPDKEEIIAYTFSDHEGKYEIVFDSSLQELYLSVSAMNYSKQGKKIANHSEKYDFTLSGEQIQLKEIVVKARPIQRRGDTINYSVKSFAQSQDRSLQDVLKRLPGIEVEKSGRVLYQGAPINKFYIEGLDLLGGRYNIANKNLPHDEISSIQILENHQPVKMLDSLVFSDKAALNIKLKNKVTAAGTATLGAGAKPLLWYANISPMFFSRKRQYILSYQTNNTGENLAEQMQNFSISSEDRLATQSYPWLSLPQATPPLVSPIYWDRNNAHFLTGSYLQKLRKDYLLRLNTWYSNNYQQVSGSSRISYFNNDETRSVAEVMKNSIFSNTLQAEVQVNKNEKDYYFNNIFNYESYWNTAEARLASNQKAFRQELTNTSFAFSNYLTTLLPMGKQIYNFKSYVFYSRLPQSLAITPGVFADLFPYSIATSLKQDLTLNHYYTNNYIGFNTGWKKISFMNKLGFIAEGKKLNTDILAEEEKTFDRDFYNDLAMRTTQLYAQTNLETFVKQWHFGIELPLTAQFTHWEDAALLPKQHRNLIKFEPSLFLRWKSNSYWEFSTKLAQDKNIGGIESLYAGYILRNYRNLQHTSGILPETRIVYYTLKAEYKNPLESIFAYINYRYNHIHNNLMYSTTLQENGATLLDAVVRDNVGKSHHYTLHADKYFGQLKTNLSFTGQWINAKAEQIFNAKRGEHKTHRLSLNIKLQTRFSRKLRTEYQGGFSREQSFWETKAQNPIVRQAHSIEMLYALLKNQTITAQAEWIKNSLFSGSKMYLFSNLKYQLSLEEKKVDFEILWNNIFNVKEYQKVFVTTVSAIEETFRVRPMQWVAKVRFRL